MWNIIFEVLKIFFFLFLYFHNTNILSSKKTEMSFPISNLLVASTLIPKSHANLNTMEKNKICEIVSFFFLNFGGVERGGKNFSE